MQITKRPYYRTKAEWATAMAESYRKAANALHGQSIPGSNWRGVRSKMAGMSQLEEQFGRYRRMAARFRARGE